MYEVRPCDRPYGTPPRWGIFVEGAPNPQSPLHSSTDKQEMEDLCEQMNDNGEELS